MPGPCTSAGAARQTALCRAYVEVTPAAERFAVQVGPHVLAFAEPPPAHWLAALVKELGSC